MQMRKCAAVACVFFGCANANADAALEEIAVRDNSIIAELKAMRERIETLQAQLDSQQKKLKTLESEELIEQDAPKVSITYNRPTITSADGRSSLAIRAVVQADSAHYSQDDPGPLETDFRRGSVGVVSRENAAARDLSDGTYFRRARLGVEGTINRDFNYRLMLELGGSGTEGPTRINDAWINYTGFAPFTIQAGAGAVPANLDDGTSVDDSLFIERATGSDIDRSFGGADGRTGILIRGNGSRWMTSLAFTGRTVNDAEALDSQRALVGRVAGLLFTDPDFNLHVGANATHILRPADSNADRGPIRYAVRLRAQPELRVDSTRLIDTGQIDADHLTAMGVELAGNYRNLTFQAEQFWYDVTRRTGQLSNPEFGAWYAQLGWVLTGESRRYNMANASYQNPRPYVNFTSQGGFGAWELALRFSHTDLDYHEGDFGLPTPADGIRGGVQDIWTLGLNWYLNANVRITANWLNVDIDRLNPSPTAFGPAPASPPVGANIGQNFDIYALRTQYTF
jgi:phosphate-selective porin OprO/OprP